MSKSELDDEEDYCLLAMNVQFPRLAEEKQKQQIGYHQENVELFVRDEKIMMRTIARTLQPYIVMRARACVCVHIFT